MDQGQYVKHAELGDEAARAFERREHGLVGRQAGDRSAQLYPTVGLAVRIGLFDLAQLGVRRFELFRNLGVGNAVRVGEQVVELRGVNVAELERWQLASVFADRGGGGFGGRVPRL